MIRGEFIRFVSTLTAAHIPDDVRKMANLVLEHLDELVLLTTYQGHRIKKISELARANWDGLSHEIELVPNAEVDDVVSISRLKSLQVGPFRGFLRQEEFDLDSELVLIYGPNGTGKTSFCEALEYGLLGNVLEAESQRTSPQEYLKNAHVRQFVEPTIEAVDLQGETFPVVANESTYRFCFVEKNRIDTFSRIAAQLPAKQTELLSSLFGLDVFNNFVRNFTPEMDVRYIDVHGQKATLLAQKRQILAGEQRTIDTAVQTFASIAQEESDLAAQYHPGMAFADLILKLGTAIAPGEISALEAELRQPVGTKAGLTFERYQGQLQSVGAIIESLDAKVEELAEAGTSLAYRQLYEAVTTLENVGGAECPACKTPIAQVTKNPFGLAAEELAKLGHLARLEQERDQFLNALGQGLASIHAAVALATDRFPLENQLAPYRLEPGTNLERVWWQSLHQINEDGFTALQHLEAQVKQLEKMDNEIDAALAKRATKEARLERLKTIERQVITLQAKRKMAEEAIQTATATVANFNDANRTLIREVELETLLVARNKNIAAAYEQLVSLLSQYMDALPSQLIADLGEEVTKLYNAFNRNDAPKDLLSSIRMPVAQGEKIQVAFQGEPARFYDALHIFSEGHIRCIGLAILMAKNIKEDCSVLVFDDPVNAIDDEHRESIRKTLFEDDYFHGKQIILTCHGEEFYKDIQNLLGPQRTQAAKRFTFLPQLGENHISIDYDSPPRNYILAAQQHLERMEIREALTKSRKALEVLAKGRVWKYLNRHGYGNLTIKLRSANSPIELRNLTEELNRKLNSPALLHEGKEALMEPIGELLGVDGASREWRYLNKGVHEEENREEFDRGVVTVIVNSIASLDSATR